MEGGRGVRVWFLLLALAMLFLILNSCSKKTKNELNVAAAVSLRDVLTEIGKNYQEDNPGVKINFNFGSSGTLKKQIGEGMSADLFIAADSREIEELVAEGKVKKETVTPLVSNRLVLVMRRDKDAKGRTIEELLGGAERIALGTPETVPVGRYARQALQYLGLWNKLQGQLIFTKDARQVLTYVETGNVDCGILYFSDAIRSSQVKIVGSFPENSYGPVLYEGVVVKGADNEEEARRFLNYLRQRDVMLIFTRYGFTALINSRNEGGRKNDRPDASGVVVKNGFVSHRDFVCTRSRLGQVDDQISFSRQRAIGTFFLPAPGAPSNCYWVWFTDAVWQQRYSG